MLLLMPREQDVELQEVNGQPALIVRVDDRAWSCVSIEIAHGQIRVIHIMLNPDKLTHI